MPKPAGFQVPVLGIYLTIPAILFIVLISFSIFALPLSPTLRITFYIGTSSPSQPPTIQITTGPPPTYAKASLFSTASITKGDITLSYLLASKGDYTLTVAISYGGSQLSMNRFSSLGTGTYQIYVAYLPRVGEQASTPYFVTFSLYYANGTPTGTPLTITIYPT